MKSQEEIIKEIIPNGCINLKPFKEMQAIKDCMNAWEKELNTRTECEHPYCSVIGEDSGNPQCLKCGKKL